MKLKAIKKILNVAQATESYGNVFTTSGHSLSFCFYTYEGNDSGDIISYDEECNCVGILSAGVNYYADCDHITHIDVYPHKD